MIFANIAMLGLTSDGEKIRAYHENSAIQYEKKERKGKSSFFFLFFSFFLGFSLHSILANITLYHSDSIKSFNTETF